MPSEAMQEAKRAASVRLPIRNASAAPHAGCKRLLTHPERFGGLTGKDIRQIRTDTVFVFAEVE